ANLIKFLHSRTRHHRALSRSHNTCAELCSSESCGAHELCRCTRVKYASQTTDMVIVPVGSDHLLDGGGWINLYLAQIGERSGISCRRIDAGIHDEPSIC